MVGLQFSVQPDKIRKFEIFTTFEKIHRSFINNLKSQETKSQIKMHLSYLANSYFYNYKPSPRILRQHRVLRNLRKNKDIVITKPDKGNGVVILDWKLYNNGIKEIIWDTSKFEKLIKDHGTPKMRKFSSSDSFPKLRPIVSSIGTFNYNLARFLCDLLSPLIPNDYSCKDTFSFVSQIKVGLSPSKKIILFASMITLQKWRKITFISSQNLFSFSRYLNFCLDFLGM